MRTRPRLALAVSLSVAALSAVTNCTSSNNANPSPYGGSPCGLGTTGDSCIGDASFPDTGCLNGSGGCAGSDAAPGTTLDAGADATIVPDDASSPDTGIADANVGDTSSPSPNVTMTVTSPTGPEPGVTVVFGDSTGAVLGSQVTDDAGVANGAISANGAVTVLFGTAASPTNVSVLGAQPGDALTVQDPTKSAPPSPGSPTMAITSTPASEPASSFTYVWFGNCGNGAESTNPGEVGLTGKCFDQTTDQTPALLLAEGDDTGGNTVEFGYAFQKANPITTFGASPANDVAMGADTWMTPTTETLLLTNPPAGATSANGYYEEFANGVVHSSWISDTDVVSSAFFIALLADGGAPDGGYPAAFPSHPGYPDFVQSEVDVFRGASLAKQVAAVRADVPTATNPFDLSQMIPTLNAPTIATSVPGRPTISWSATGPVPSSGVGALLTFTWSTATASGTWTLVSPATASTAQAPALPAGLSAWAPLSADGGVVGTSGTPTAVVAGGTAVPTYGQFRAVYPTPANLTVSATLTVPLPPLANDGTFYVSAYE